MTQVNYKYTKTSKNLFTLHIGRTTMKGHNISANYMQQLWTCWQVYLCELFPSNGRYGCYCRHYKQMPVSCDCRLPLAASNLLLQNYQTHKQALHAFEAQRPPRGRFLVTFTELLYLITTPTDSTNSIDVH